jgi:hypothetical protein
MLYKNKKSNNKKLYGLLAVLTLAGLFALLELSHTTNLLGKSAPASGSEAKEAALQPKDSQGGTPDLSKPADTKKSGGSGTPTYLLSPENSDYISSHEVSLSANPLLQSTCVTSAGAKCTIIFTNGGDSISLPTQTTDPTGASYWSWRLKDYGFTTGSWTIQAKASLSGQTKTSKDSLNLTVKE